MFHSQIIPRRNQSVAVNRHNTSQTIVARRAVSPNPFKELPRKRSPSPQRHSHSQTIHIMQKPRIVSIAGDGRMPQYRCQSPVRIMAQPQPIQRVIIKEQPKPIFVYVRQPCPLRHVQETTTKPQTNTPAHCLPPFTPPKIIQRKESKELSAAGILNTDSMNEGTNKQVSFAVEDEIQFELSEHFKSNHTIENVSTHNNQTNPTGNYTDPLDQCISSLEHRVQLMLQKDKAKNRSRFLRQIVHQGINLKYNK